MPDITRRAPPRRDSPESCAPWSPRVEAMAAELGRLDAALFAGWPCVPHIRARMAAQRHKLLAEIEQMKRVEVAALVLGGNGTT